MLYYIVSMYVNKGVEENMNAPCCFIIVLMLILLIVYVVCKIYENRLYHKRVRYYRAANAKIV
jgi:hypothetical protein